MDSILNNSGKNSDGPATIERRIRERRTDQRRRSNPDMKYDGEERRSVSDRRVTIINRLKRDVTDRRALN